MGSSILDNSATEEPAAKKLRTDADVKADSNADVKADSNADVKADSNVDVKADSNADVKADSNADVKTDSNADVKADSNVDVKADSNADVKADSNADVKADSNADVKADSNADVKADSNDKSNADVKESKKFSLKNADADADVGDEEADVEVNADADEDDSLDEDRLAHRPFAEADVGIELFLGSHPGFAGALKANWEDFHVHEIDSAGCPARLTTLEIPREETNVEDVLTPEQKQQLLKLSLDECSKMLNEEVVIECGDDKDWRTKLHKCIKTQYPSLCSNTAERNGVKVIVVKQKRNSTQERREWPKTRGSFCHFVMHLHGKGTLNAIDNIARGMRMKASHFAYCGTKDKRAVTSQWVSVHKVEASRIKSVANRISGISVGNFCYKQNPLRLGDHLGNEFSLVIRDVKASPEDIAGSVASLQSAGFINYFGLQRFGQSGNGGTFEVGRALLRCQWSAAIDRILEPCGADNPTARRWKLAYKRDGNAAACAARMRTGLERSLLLGIARQGGQNLSALQSLPRNLLQLFGHSYQSLLWNRLATARLKLYGPTPVVGDLVQLADGSVRQIGGDSPDCPTDPAACQLSSVVLPLPGFDVQLPGNAIGEALRNMLAEDGLTLADLRHRVKDLALPGSYRPLIVKPESVSHSLLQYADPRQSLLPSDRDLLDKPEQQVQLQIPSNSASMNEAGNLKTAILLRMRLPKSAYATMAVRELSRGQITVLSSR